MDSTKEHTPPQEAADRCEDSTTQTVSPVALRLAQALLASQRRMLALMLAERSRAVEHSSPREAPVVKAQWDRAIRNQLRTVQRMAAEVDRLRAAVRTEFPSAEPERGAAAA
ncbi:MAG: hypothetical protein HYY04_10960 [Chloroflexi bacterium]|nr:hypothetical protein [Chloroflexota bacterium]